MKTFSPYYAEVELSAYQAVNGNRDWKDVANEGFDAAVRRGVAGFGGDSEYTENRLRSAFLRDVKDVMKRRMR